MAKTIELRKLNQIFVDYLANDDATNFVVYLAENGYTTGSGSTYEYTNKADALFGADVDLSAQNPAKYGEYLRYLANVRENLSTNTDKIAADRLAQRMADIVIVSRQGMGLTREEANKVYRNLNINKDKVPTAGGHGAINQIGRKGVAPAVATGATVTAVWFIISALLSAGFAIAQIPLITGTVWLDIIALGSWGILAGVATTAAVTLGRYLYSKHRVKQSIKQVEATDKSIYEMDNLAVKDFVEKYVATESKILSSKNKFANFFRRVANYNRYKEINKFRKQLDKEVAKDMKTLEKNPSSETFEQIERNYKRKNELLTYINSEIDGALVENIMAYKKGDVRKVSGLRTELNRYGKAKVNEEGHIVKANKANREVEGLIYRKLSAKQRKVAGNEVVKDLVYMPALTKGFNNDTDLGTGYGVRRNMVAIATERATKVQEKADLKQAKADKKEEKKQIKTAKREEIRAKKEAEAIEQAGKAKLEKEQRIQAKLDAKQKKSEEKLRRMETRASRANKNVQTARAEVAEATKANEEAEIPAFVQKIIKENKFKGSQKSSNEDKAELAERLVNFPRYKSPEVEEAAAVVPFNQVKVEKTDVEKLQSQIKAQETALMKLKAQRDSAREAADEAAILKLNEQIKKKSETIKTKYAQLDSLKSGKSAE